MAFFLPIVVAACLGMVMWFSPAAANAADLTPEELRTPGVYAVENGGLVSVASGRISTTLGKARAERLAQEQALRNARQQLALHLYKDKLSGPEKFSVSISGARIINQNNDGNAIFVALLADPARVSLVPRSPLEDFNEVNAAPIVGELLTRMATIADGGGMVFDVDGGWVGLGVGYAALPEPATPEALRKAKTIARVAAAEALTGFIYGVQVDTWSEEHSIFAESPAGAVFKEWSQDKTREEIAGFLNGAQTAGEWFTDDNHVGVAVLVGQPPLDLAAEFEDAALVQDETGGSADEPLLYKSDITVDWQRILLARPWILAGGTSLCKHEGTLYAIVVESGVLKGNAAYDRMQLPTMLDAKARNQLTRYLLGFSSKTVTQSEESRFADLQGEDVTQSLNTVSREGAVGVVSGIKRMGSWYSEDEKTLFQAFAVPLP